MNLTITESIMYLLLAIVGIFAFVCFMMSVNKAKRYNYTVCSNFSCALKKDCYHYITNTEKDTILIAKKKDLMVRRNERFQESYCINYLNKNNNESNI